MRAVIDTECQRGLQQLRELMSHVDPHLTDRATRGAAGAGGTGALRSEPPPAPEAARVRLLPDDERSSGTAGREMADRVAAAAENPRRPGKSAAPAVIPFRSEALREAGGRQRFAGRPCRQVVAPGEPWPRRPLGSSPGSRTSAPKRVAPRADRGRSAGGAVATELTSAPKPRVAAGGSIPDRSTGGAGSAKPTSTAKSRVATGSSTTGAERPAAQGSRRGGLRWRSPRRSSGQIDSG